MTPSLPLTKTHTRSLLQTHTQQPPTLFTITTATAAASPPSPSSPFRTYASSTPPLFTDKLVAWDAAAPLAQDFALAVQGM